MAFAAFAVVGFVCVGLSAFRASKSQIDLNNQLRDIKAEVGKLLNGQQDVFSRLQTTRGTSERYQQVIIQPTPLPAPEHAHLIVDRVNYSPIDPGDPDGAQAITLELRNTGQIAAVSQETTTKFAAVDASHLTTSFVDAAMRDVTATAIRNKRSINWNEQEIGAGQAISHRLEGGFTGPLWSQVRAGKLYAIVVAATTYTDRSLKKGQFYVSEFCSYSTGDLANTGFCPGHNRTWLEK